MQPLYNQRMGECQHQRGVCIGPDIHPVRPHEFRHIIPARADIDDADPLIRHFLEPGAQRMGDAAAARNLRDAYGLGLTLRRDSDLDGWPDAWDHAPFTKGYKDGVNN